MYEYKNDFQRDGVGVFGSMMGYRQQPVEMSSTEILYCISKDSLATLRATEGIFKSMSCRLRSRMKVEQLQRSDHDDEI